MSNENRRLLERILAAFGGARGFAALWLAVGLFTLVCIVAMGRLGRDDVLLVHALVVAPLFALAVLGPEPRPALHAMRLDRPR